MTDEIKNMYISQWTSEIYNWLNRAKKYVYSQQGLMEKLDASTKMITKSGKASLIFEDMLKTRKAAQQSITNTAILSDGYILLNKIGEIIRGAEIMYSVTFTETGDAISEAQSGQVYTWRMPMSDFLNLVTYSSRRMTMRSSSSIYKMMQAQINKNITYEKWSEQKLHSYQLFINQARSAANGGKWSKVNEGNILEAFLRFLDSGHIVEHSERREYWNQIRNVMSQTLSAPDPFFKGGDINDEQIKSLNASVTNINTLIRNLTEVLNILATTTSGYEAIKPYVKTKAMSKVSEKFQQSVENGVQNLIDFFTSKIDRNSITFLT